MQITWITWIRVPSNLWAKILRNLRNLRATFFSHLPAAGSRKRT